MIRHWILFTQSKYDYSIFSIIDTNYSEVIMTTGQSRTVQEFLIRAAQKLKFQVIVAETAPS